MSGESVLLVDDEQHIIELAQMYLEKEGYAVTSASDGERALELIAEAGPDLVVLDLMLPDRDGWDITRFIRADLILAEIPIIMLTARVEDVDKILGLELGADDYITKPFNPREVVARVNALLRRTQMNGQSIASQVIQVGELKLDTGRREVSKGEQIIDLTPTEFNLLHTLMENPGYAFTRSELIEKGLGYTYEGLDRTLDSHIKNLRRKIEPDPGNLTYIQTVYGVGYRLRGEP